MKDKMALLGGKGHLIIDGVRHQVGVVLSPIGELSISIISLETGVCTECLSLDAVSAFDLYELQSSFYKGELEEEMTDEAP